MFEDTHHFAPRLDRYPSYHLDQLHRPSSPPDQRFVSIHINACPIAARFAPLKHIDNITSGRGGLAVTTPILVPMIQAEHLVMATSVWSSNRHI